MAAVDAKYRLDRRHAVRPRLNPIVCRKMIHQSHTRSWCATRNRRCGTLMDAASSGYNGKPVEGRLAMRVRAALPAILACAPPEEAQKKRPRRVSHFVSSSSSLMIRLGRNDESFSSSARRILRQHRRFRSLLFFSADNSPKANLILSRIDFRHKRCSSERSQKVKYAVIGFYRWQTLFYQPLPSGFPLPDAAHMRIQGPYILARRGQIVQPVSSGHSALYHHILPLPLPGIGTIRNTLRGILATRHHHAAHNKVEKVACIQRDS